MLLELTRRRVKIKNTIALHVFVLVCALRWCVEMVWWYTYTVTRFDYTCLEDIVAEDNGDDNEIFMLWENLYYLTHTFISRATTDDVSTAPQTIPSTTELPLVKILASWKKNYPKLKKSFNTFWEIRYVATCALIFRGGPFRNTSQVYQVIRQ